MCVDGMKTLHLRSSAAHVTSKRDNCASRHVRRCGYSAKNLRQELVVSEVLVLEHVQRHCVSSPCYEVKVFGADGGGLGDRIGVVPQTAPHSPCDTSRTDVHEAILMASGPRGIEQPTPSTLRLLDLFPRMQMCRGRRLAKGAAQIEVDCSDHVTT